MKTKIFKELKKNLTEFLLTRSIHRSRNDVPAKEPGFAEIADVVLGGLGSILQLLWFGRKNRSQWRCGSWRKRANWNQK